MARPLFLALLCLILCRPEPLSAQWFDALLPKRGELQIAISGQNLGADQRYEPDGNVRPLSEVFALELDTRLVPPLGSLDSLLAGLLPALGLETPPPSTLGRLRYDVLSERTRAPISLTFSATDWLALFFVVPIVQGQSFVGAELDSSSAAAGLAGTAFGADPAGFFSGLDQAIGQLESMVAADTLSAELRMQAEALIGEARALEAGLVSLGQLEYVPTDSSAAGRELTGFYEDLRAGFEVYLIPLPTLALSRPLTADEAILLSSGPEFGIQPVGNTSTGIKFGDIELGLSVQPINTLRGHPATEPPRFLLRARLDALWRFASGSPPDSAKLTDVGTGDGQPDLELRSTLDIGYGRRFWLSLFAAYNAQFASTLSRLVTSPAAPIQLGAYVSEVRWDPGDVISFAASPRLNLTDAITFSFFYSILHHARDQVRPLAALPADAAFLPEDLEDGTEYSAQRLGFAARYASTGWRGVRRTGLPIEVELRYWRTVSARDGLVPRDDVWQVSLRLYRALFR